jgi:hypothetical protein
MVIYKQNKAVFVADCCVQKTYTLREENVLLYILFKKKI